MPLLRLGDYEWAHIVGIPEEELARIEQMDPDGFDRRKWIALSYVRALVSGSFGDVPKDLKREMHDNYCPHEIKEIELVAGSWISVTAAPTPGMRCCPG